MITFMTTLRARPRVNSYRDLIVWQRAMDLVVTAYRLTKRFPVEERYALVQQVRRSAVSVPSNIAEGHGRNHLGDYLRHLSIARGSLMELETQLLIAGRMAYIGRVDGDGILEKSAEVGRMLSGLIRTLQEKYRGRGARP